MGSLLHWVKLNKVIELAEMESSIAKKSYTILRRL